MMLLLLFVCMVIERKSLSVFVYKMNFFINLIFGWERNRLKAIDLMAYHLVVCVSVNVVVIRILTGMLASFFHCHYRCHCLDRLPVRCHYQPLWLQHCIFQSIYMVMEVVILAPVALQQLHSIQCRPFVTTNRRKTTQKIIIFKTFSTFHQFM